MVENNIGVIGLGYQVPALVRLNDDPIFDALKKNSSQKEILALFQGFERRHVLGPDESLVSIMVAAAEKAMIDAGVTAADIDLLMGCASLSHYIVPSDLGALHGRLGLPERAMPLPLGNDFSNFTESLVIADALIRVGRVRRVLVVAGGDWTRAVNYNQGASVSAADGAGAAVLGVASAGVRWIVQDQQALVRSDLYGAMYVSGDPLKAEGQPENQEYSGPYFHMTQEGYNDFKSFGGKTAAISAQELLQRQGLSGSDITLIGHQASTLLLDAWADALKTKPALSTIKDFGNMTVASIAVTLAAREEDIDTPYVMLLALGLDLHAHAVLLRRVM
ncbi:3-oxoacyl-[acyl-carrier-protein] synthase III C-terminal domain-containing protein [Rhizobium jaguaris]|uniref:3-oxoacyl-ACP synthase n=1 Tax=Rhizobium jaguaris TaxID=1312183 RepID=A0A387G2K6_9HYPH|nr:3-oxoacyl-[acyl-carrier-protein] synthase III C-terminal domain-containing protein [Rhizobium jaguaris]AYG62564.1 3-oxoacyl-ACP synthase [Rhizobium jaguaris]